MSEFDRNLIIHRLNRADEALLEAKLLLDNGFANGAAGKAYYASFYAVSALLTTKNLFSKTHKGIRVLFSKHFIESGIIPRSFATSFANLYRCRQEGDYSDYIETDIEAATVLLSDAQDIVNFIRTFVQPLIA